MLRSLVRFQLAPPSVQPAPSFPVGDEYRLFGFRPGANASGDPLNQALWCDPTSQKHLRLCAPNEIIAAPVGLNDVRVRADEVGRPLRVGPDTIELLQCSRIFGRRCAA